MEYELKLVETDDILVLSGQEHTLETKVARQERKIKGDIAIIDKLKPEGLNEGEYYIIPDASYTKYTEAVNTGEHSYILMENVPQHECAIMPTQGFLDQIGNLLGISLVETDYRYDSFYSIFKHAVQKSSHYMKSASLLRFNNEHSKVLYYHYMQKPIDFITRRFASKHTATGGVFEEKELALLRKDLVALSLYNSPTELFKYIQRKWTLAENKYLFKVLFECSYSGAASAYKFRDLRSEYPFIIDMAEDAQTMSRALNNLKDMSAYSNQAYYEEQYDNILSRIQDKYGIESLEDLLDNRLPLVQMSNVAERIAKYSILSDYKIQCDTY